MGSGDVYRLFRIDPALSQNEGFGDRAGITTQ
jgi:hypothetical protein